MSKYQIPDERVVSVELPDDLGSRQKRLLIDEEYLSERAARGDKRKFKGALAKVRKIRPDKNDQL